MLTIAFAGRGHAIAPARPASSCRLWGTKVRLVLPVLCLVLMAGAVTGQTFVHPGGIETLADLNRMKAKVAAKTYPYINGWNLLIQDFKAQKTYVPVPSSTIGGSNGTRQQAATDAIAAYYNTLEWYITGDTGYANCAVRILNAWSASVTQVVTGELFQLPACMLVQAGEMLRIYPYWASSDFTRFKNFCSNYIYPACHASLGQCGSWPSWDAPAMAAICYIGVLCDDTAKFNEAVNYYKSGAGGGNITNDVLNAGGQLYEVGRDQPHAEIGPQFAAEMCQTAWNQGVDLYSYDSNRLLAGFEYYCQFNLNHPVSWTYYPNCANVNFYYPAYQWQDRISQAPVYELVYNHYVTMEGLKMPYTRAMINLRGIAATGGQYWGYSALTYTLADTTTVFVPKPKPSAPINLTAQAGVSNVVLNWASSGVDNVNGYNVLRSTKSGGPYTTVSSWTGNTITSYNDTGLVGGTTYYYRVSAINLSGTSGNSSEVSVTPVSSGTALPIGWSLTNIGSVPTPGKVTYDTINNQTFLVTGSGNQFGSGSSDDYAFVYLPVSGDFTITARVPRVVFSSTNADRGGLIMRESMNANSAMASIADGDNAFQHCWFAWQPTGGSTTWVPGDLQTWVPVWYRLQRSGNTFTGYQSLDGVTWFNVGSTSIAMATNYYVGMFVNSGSTTAGVVTTATFDNVSYSGTTVVNDTVEIANRATGKYIDNQGSTSNGSNVGQWQLTGSNNQKWVIQSYGSYYRLQCLTAGEYLDDLGNTADGSSIGQWSNTGSYNQQWSFIPTGGYYWIQNRGNGKCLDTGGDTANGSVIKCWPQDASYKQLWSLGNAGVGAASISRQAVMESSVQEISDVSSSVKIYPNPVKDRVYINCNSGKAVLAEVYSLSGALLRASGSQGESFSIDLAGLPAGLMIVKVNDGQHVYIKKIEKL